MYGCNAKSRHTRRKKLRIDTLYDIKKIIKISVSIVFYNSTEIDIKRVFQNMSNVHVKYLQRNDGFGAGHNSVLKDLDSDYHIIMNPDVSLNDTDGLIKAINYMNSHSDVVLLSPLVRNENDNQIQYLNRMEPTVFDLLIRFLGPNFFSKRQSKFVKKLGGYDHIQLEENATGSFMLTKTIELKKINGFDTRFFMYFEDTDLTKRMAEEGKVIFFPYFTIVHGWKRDNHTLKGLRPMILSMIKYFNKWGWKLY